MSRENVEAVSRGYAAFQRRDVDAILAEMVEDCEFHDTGIIGSTVHQGPAAIGRYLRAVFRNWSDFGVDVEELIPVGDHVVAVVRLRGTGAISGVSVVARFDHVWTLREGKGVRWVAYGTREEAIEAVGLSE